MPPSELGPIATMAAVERAGIEPFDVAHVVFGNVIDTEPGDTYMARVVGMKASIPRRSRPTRLIVVWNGRPSQRPSRSRPAKRKSPWPAGRNHEPRDALDAERSLGRPYGRRSSSIR